MPLTRDELDEGHRVISTMVGVLLHELRNPLHSGTLLLEAMGSKSADLPALRAKLRNQLAKIDAIIAEAAGPIKELAPPPRIEKASLQQILDDVIAEFDDDVEPRVIETEAARGVAVLTDAVLVRRAIGELCSRALERAAGGAQGFALRVARDDTGIRIAITDTGPELSEAARKAPFTIAAGGVRLALARGLADAGGATLRLESSTEAGTTFILGFRAANLASHP